MKPLKVLWVEDSDLFRDALATVFPRSREFAFSSCGSAHLAEEFRRMRYATLVINAATWSSGIEALDDLVEEMSSKVAVILLGGEDLLLNHRELLQKGIVGFVDQKADSRTLLKAIRAVASGGVWFDTELFKRVTKEAGMDNKAAKAGDFNAREQEIMSLVAKGKTNKEIGVCLGFTERTVKSYVANLFRKTGVSNRSGLASFAVNSRMSRLDSEIPSTSQAKQETRFSGRGYAAEPLRRRD